jgi:monoterpene epsilon-lactone hydrolase
MKPSFSSKLLTGILKLINFKKLVEQRVENPIRKSGNGFVPKIIKRSYHHSTRLINKKAVTTFENKKKVTNKHIIFFHGGAYVFEASISHWILARKIVASSFCRMTLVDYPLAPEHDYKETFEMAEGAYEMLIKNYPDDELILMGDSAGGGLVLALAQKFNNEKHSKPPVRNILLSPWLDISMSNPEIKPQVDTDHILTVKMLSHAGSKYANGDNPNDYKLSPINGVFQGIPKTLVFYGTQELFYADCLKLKRIVATASAEFTFKEYQGMQHDWAIFPIPERERVIQEICTFIEA